MNKLLLEVMILRFKLCMRYLQQHTKGEVEVRGGAFLNNSSFVRAAGREGSVSSLPRPMSVFVAPDLPPP